MEITRHYFLEVQGSKLLVVDVNCSLLWQNVAELKDNTRLIRELLLQELQEVVQEVESLPMGPVEKIDLSVSELRYSLQVWNSLLRAVQSKRETMAVYVITEQSSTDREHYMSTSKMWQNWDVSIPHFSATERTPTQEEEIEEDQDEILIKFMLMQVFEELGVPESDFESVLTEYNSLADVVSHLS